MNDVEWVRRIAAGSGSSRASVRDGRHSAPKNISRLPATAGLASSRTSKSGSRSDRIRDRRQCRQWLDDAAHRSRRARYRKISAELLFGLYSPPTDFRLRLGKAHCALGNPRKILWRIDNASIMRTRNSSAIRRASPNALDPTTPAAFLNFQEMPVGDFNDFNPGWVERFYRISR